MKIAKIAGCTILAFVILLLVLPFFLKGKVKDVVVSQAGSLLNAELYMEDFSLGFFSNFPHATLSVDDFGIVGVGAFSGDTLVDAERINVVINLASIFGSAYEINKVELVSPSVKAIVNADSLANWDILKSDTAAVEEPADEASSSVNLSLNEILVSGLCVSYQSVPDSMTAKVEGIDLDMSGDIALDLNTLINIDGLKVVADRILYQDNSSSNMAAALENVDLNFSGAVGDKVSQIHLLLDVDSTTVSLGGIPYLSKAKISSDINMEADLDSNKYTFGENRVSLNEIALNFAGYVQLVDSLTTDMDLTLSTPSIDFKQILSLVPVIYANDFASLETAGEVALAATAKGRMCGDTIPAFDANLIVKDAMFRYPDLPGSVTQINVEAKVKNPGSITDSTELSVPKFTLSLMGSPFAMTLGLKTPVSDPDFSFTADGSVNFANVSKVVRLENMDLQGMLTAALKANGRMSYVDQEKYELFRIAGDLTLSDFVFSTNSLDYDVKVNKADMVFSSQNINLDAALALGKSDLTLNGKLQHFIQYVMRGETLIGSLDVKSNLIDANQLLGISSSEDDAAATETATADTTANADASSVAIPANLDFALNLSVDKLLYDAIVLQTVKGNLSVKEGVADIQRLSANTMGGALAVEGMYDTKDTLNPKVEVDLNVSDMNVSEVFTTVAIANKLVPLLSDAEGNFSMDMKFTSVMDATLSPVLNTVNAKGVFKSKDISIKNVKAFNALAEKTGVDLLKKPNLKDLNIAFVVKDGRLNIDPFETIVSSTKLNFSGSSGLDETLDYVAKVQLPQNISSAIDLAFDMNIGGTFKSPKITFSASSLKNQVIEKVTEVVDKAKEAAIQAAKEQKEKLVAAAKSQRDKLVSAAQASSDKLVAKAQAQCDSIVAKAANPMAKKVAQKSGEALVKKAKSEGDKLVNEAKKNGDNLVGEAEKQGDALVEKASSAGK